MNIVDLYANGGIVGKACEMKVIIYKSVCWNMQWQSFSIAFVNRFNMIVQLCSGMEHFVTLLHSNVCIVE